MAAKSHVTKREAQAVCDYAANLCEALHTLVESWDAAHGR
jgi:hypothetical protein